MSHQLAPWSISHAAATVVLLLSFPSVLRHVHFTRTRTRSAALFCFGSTVVRGRGLPVDRLKVEASYTRYQASRFDDREP